MDSINSQQILNLQLASANTFETFHSGLDQTLISVLQSVAVGVLEEPQIFLWGSESTGKTHILQAMCHLATQSRKRVMYIPLQQLATHDPESIAELQDLDLICIDDAQVIVKNAMWEKALFNFINHHREQKTTIVISSLMPPSDSLFNLPDLNSRSVWGPVYKLNPLKEDELDVALQLHAKARGLEISIEVQSYLLSRYQRDISSLVNIIERLDTASLQEQRKITIPFLKKVLTAS